MSEKELEILDKSAEVFLRYGVKAVTMDDLARELSISKKTIYKYFEDKKALVRAVVRRKIDNDILLSSETLDKSENAIDELIQISKSIQEQFGSLHTSVFFDLKKYHKDAWDIMENHKKDFVKGQITQNIERGIKEGIYRENIDAQIIAMVYITTFDSVFDEINNTNPDKSVSEVFIEIIRFLIRGLANDKGINYLKQRINLETKI